MSKTSPGAIPSPNIWHHTATYELENQAVDKGGLIEQAMREIAPRAGRTFLDLGCGTGFHLPRWAADATRVIGVEPHQDLLSVAARRTRRLGNVTLLQGTAQSIPLPDSSVDVVQARWAYFFGPGCDPGLTEVDRVIRHGGTAFVIDNDATRSTFGGWFRRGYPSVDPRAVERFWTSRGWSRTPLDITWSFDTREDLEAVVRIEFSSGMADQILASWTPAQGLEVDYAVNLWHRTY